MREEMPHQGTAPNKANSLDTELLHYTIFMSKGELGSIHDYHIHKENYSNYILYLFKESAKAVVLPCN